MSKPFWSGDRTRDIINHGMTQGEFDFCLVLIAISIFGMALS